MEDKVQKATGASYQGFLSSIVFNFKTNRGQGLESLSSRHLFINFIIMPKLYEVPKNTRIKFAGEEFDFHHIDGMYSYRIDEYGGVCHIGANSDVEIVE